MISLEQLKKDFESLQIQNDKTDKAVLEAMIRYFLAVKDFREIAFNAQIPEQPSKSEEVVFTHRSTNQHSSIYYFEDLLEDIDRLKKQGCKIDNSFEKFLDDYKLFLKECKENFLKKQGIEFIQKTEKNKD